MIGRTRKEGEAAGSGPLGVDGPEKGVHPHTLTHSFPRTRPPPPPLPPLVPAQARVYFNPRLTALVDYTPSETPAANPSPPQVSDPRTQLSPCALFVARVAAGSPSRHGRPFGDHLRAEIRGARTAGCPLMTQVPTGLARKEERGGIDGWSLPGVESACSATRASSAWAMPHRTSALPAPVR